MTKEEWAEHNKVWTVEEFNDWQIEQAAALKVVQAQNQREVDSFVIKEVMHYLKKGMTLQAAGDRLLKSNNRIGGMSNGVIITKAAVLRSLEAIGWKSKDERKKGLALHEN